MKNNENKIKIGISKRRTKMRQTRMKKHTIIKNKLNS